MWSKRREIIIGGLKLSLTIRKGALESFEMGGRLYGKDDPIAKSFTKKFLTFLESQDGRNPTNFNNPLYKKDKELFAMLSKEQLSIRNGLNKFTNNLIDKKYLNFSSVAKEVMSSGLLSIKKLEKIKTELDKPRGLKGILYKTLKSIVNFNAKEAVERLAPSEFDISKYTVKDYSAKKDEVIEEISADEIHKKMMIEFMKMIAENQVELLKTQKEFNENIAGKVSSETKEQALAKKEKNEKNVEKPVDKTATVTDEKEMVETPIEFVPTVNFNSKDVKDEISSRWSETKRKNISSEEPCPEFLNINAIRFNGISNEKLNRWKENELSKKNPTISLEIADGYIAKNMSYAKQLAAVGILKEIKPNEFKFTSVKAKEVLYLQYDNNLDEIKAVFQATSSNKKSSKVQSELKSPKIDKNSSVEPKKVSLEKQKMVDFAKDEFFAFAEENPKLVSEQDKSNFEKHLSSLIANNPSPDILATELSNYIQGFIKYKTSSQASDIEMEDIAGFDTVEELITHSANAAYNVGTDEEKDNEQKIANAVIEIELDKNIKEIEKNGKNIASSVNQSKLS